MNKPILFVPLLAKITLLIVGLFLIFSALFTIYTNLKKDNVDGRGWIAISEDCRHTGPWDGDSECKGTYRQNGGDITIADAIVQTSDKYSRGEFVGDIYRNVSVNYEAPANEQHYITGEERRSLIYNLPSVLVILLGIFMIIAVVAISFIKKFKQIRFK